MYLVPDYLQTPMGRSTPGGQHSILPPPSTPGSFGACGHFFDCSLCSNDPSSGCSWKISWSDVNMVPEPNSSFFCTAGVG